MARADEPSSYWVASLDGDDHDRIAAQDAREREHEHKLTVLRHFVWTNTAPDIGIYKDLIDLRFLELGVLR